MGLYGDRHFRGASQASTPGFAQAASRQSQLENDAQQQENAQLSNNVMGAGALYNEAMGDNTPLADMAARYFGTNEAGIGSEIPTALRQFEFGGGEGMADMADMALMTQEELAQALAVQQAAAL